MQPIDQLNILVQIQGQNSTKKKLTKNITFIRNFIFLGSNLTGTRFNLDQTYSLIKIRL